MKILFVGMGNSSHSYKWVSQLFGQKWDIHFFSAYEIPGHAPVFRGAPVAFYRSRPSRLRLVIDLILHPVKAVQTFRQFGLRAVYTALLERQKHFQEQRLAKVIREVQPDIIHTMHTQTAGYLTVKVRRNWKGKFPVWIHSVWGSDLYYWGRFPEKRRELREILSFIDYFLGEGKRDQYLADGMGFKGKFLAPVPVSGGFNLETLRKVKMVPPSKRKQISLKGYQDIVGRFYVGLRALELIKDEIEDYEINVFCLKDEGARINLKLFEIETGLKVHIVEKVSYLEMLAMHARSRVSIGLSISDGLPASFLEAMAMGSFPVQSDTSIGDEWAENGRSAFFVPANDPQIVAEAIRKALRDDELVDKASEINRKTISQRANFEDTSKNAIEIYKKVAGKTEVNSANERVPALDLR